METLKPPTQEASKPLLKKKKHSPLLEEPNRERHLIERDLRLLKQVARSYPIEKESMLALGGMVKITESFKNRMDALDSELRGLTNGELEKVASIKKERARLEECHDSCRFAIEDIAKFAEDREVRTHAFEYIQSNSIAVRFCYLLSPYQDIREIARKKLPKKPDAHYATISNYSDLK